MKRLQKPSVWEGVEQTGAAWRRPRGGACPGAGSLPGVRQYAYIRTPVQDVLAAVVLMHKPWKCSKCPSRKNTKR